MNGLFEFDLAAHLVWWVAGAMFLVLVVIALVEIVGLAREAWANRGAGEPSAGEFQVREDGALRERHMKRHRPGWRNLDSRGLGEPPVRTAREWSPTAHRSAGTPITDDEEIS
jgi:hypothetical protein